MSTILFDRKEFFENVRHSIFDGSLKQSQVDGLEALLDAWEKDWPEADLRWLAYALATTVHESAFTCQPIAEYGKGKGKPYGRTDPETGQVYFGRGYIQTTWRANYARADRELGLTGADSCEWHADNQLRPDIAAATLYRGLNEGWFRKSGGTPNDMAKYFNATTDDAYMAREAVNGDKAKVPAWSSGVSIGDLIKGYHEDFLAALKESMIAVVPSEPEIPVAVETVDIALTTTPGVSVSITINGQIVLASKSV